MTANAGRRRCRIGCGARAGIGDTSVLLLIASLTLPASLAAQKVSNVPAIVVGPNVQVTAARPGVTHDEVLIAADPRDASHLLACSMFLPKSGVYELTGVSAYASFDAGRSWSPVLTDAPEVYGKQGRFDPACTYGPDGTAYVVLLPMRLYRSADAGRTWHRVDVPAPRAPDRVYVVADNTGGANGGRVYVYGQMPGQFLDSRSAPSAVTLWRSFDRGRTFAHPIQAFPDTQQQGRTAFHPGTSVVMSDGTWAAVFDQLDLGKRNDGLVGSEREPPRGINARIKVITSSDGGETLDGAVTVSDAYSDWRADNTIPSIAVDDRGTVFKNRLYVVWADGRFHGSSRPALADGRIGGRAQVLLSYSDDRGKTWSMPRLVNDDLRYRDTGGLERGVGLVSVAVNDAGVVGVAWQDRRNNERDEVGYSIRFAASLDGGETFTPSVQVAEEPRVVGQDERWVPQISAAGATAIDIFRKEWDTGGHTMGLAADASGVFHPLWVDNRTGVHQIWTATVEVRGVVAKFGAPELARFGDIGKSLAIEGVATSFDRETRRLQATIRLRNKSTDTISGPVKVRALTILSEASTSGTAEVLGADNGMTGTGAVWDFTKSLPHGSLAPDSASLPRTLVFQLPGLRVMRKGSEFRFERPWPGGLLHFEAQVLGDGPRLDKTTGNRSVPDSP